MAQSEVEGLQAPWSCGGFCSARRNVSEASSSATAALPSTWLCAIAKNLYFSELRRQKRRVPFPEAAPQDTVPFEEQLVDRETARSLLRVAKELREPYRQVFFLRFSGLPFREIGDAAGKTESWARVTFFRAKAMILSELEETP